MESPGVPGIPGRPSWPGDPDTPGAPLAPSLPGLPGVPLIIIIKKNKKQTTETGVLYSEHPKYLDSYTCNLCWRVWVYFKPTVGFRLNVTMLSEFTIVIDWLSYGCLKNILHWLSSLFLTGIPGMPGSPFLPGKPPPDTAEPGSPWSINKAPGKYTLCT